MCSALGQSTIGRCSRESAAVIHHGGAGTTHAAVAAGVPSVVIPHVGDQPYWAARLHQLGVAPSPLDLKAVTPDAVRERVAEATTEPIRAAARAPGPGSGCRGRGAGRHRADRGRNEDTESLGIDGVPGRIRTCDRPLRRRLLWSTELRGREARPILAPRTRCAATLPETAGVGTSNNPSPTTRWRIASMSRRRTASLAALLAALVALAGMQAGTVLAQDNDRKILEWKTMVGVPQAFTGTLAPHPQHQWGRGAVDADGRQGQASTERPSGRSRSMAWSWPAPSATRLRRSARR